MVLLGPKTGITLAGGLLASCVLSLPPVENGDQGGEPSTPPPSTRPTPPTTPGPSAGAVRLSSSNSCEGSTCHQLEVSCEGIPARQVRVREFRSSGDRGTVIFSTGVYGIKRYDEGQDSGRTIRDLGAAGFQVFQVEWGGGRTGWGTGAGGSGFKRALCGYAEVVRWIASDRARNSAVVCAQGNSGGALQNAYGLAVYGLEDTLDLAILSGGPPLSRVDKFCFGKGKESGGKPSGRRMVDYMLGWEAAAPCSRKAGSNALVSQAQDDSLVTTTEARDYDYPDTRIHFVVSERDRSRIEGRVFYDAVRSHKEWHWMPGSTHGIDNTPEGGQLITEIMTRECRNSG